MGSVGEVRRWGVGSEVEEEEEEEEGGLVMISEEVSGEDFESKSLNFDSISPWAKKPESLRKEEFI